MTSYKERFDQLSIRFWNWHHTLTTRSHLDATALLSIIKHMEEQGHKDTDKREQREVKREQREFEREKWQREETEKRERYDREQRQWNDKCWDRLLQLRDNLTATLISSSSIANIRVPQFCKQAKDNTDITSFLVNFQSHMESNTVPKRHWAAHLVSVLNRSAQQAHTAFETTVKQDYDQLRELLLKHFHVNCDSYRSKMFSLKKLPQESWVTYWRRTNNGGAIGSRSARREKKSVTCMMQRLFSVKCHHG